MYNINVNDRVHDYNNTVINAQSSLHVVEVKDKAYSILCTTWKCWFINSYQYFPQMKEFTGS